MYLQNDFNVTQTAPPQPKGQLTEESLINASLEAKQMNLLHLAGKSFPMTKVNVKPLILDRTQLDLIESSRASKLLCIWLKGQSGGLLVEQILGLCIAIKSIAFILLKNPFHTVHHNRRVGLFSF